MRQGRLAATCFENGAESAAAALEPDREREDRPCENRSEPGEPEGREDRRDTDARRDPDRGGGRETVHLVLLDELEDRAGAQEADSGDDSLDDAARVGGCERGLAAREDEERGADCDEDVCPEARGAVDL